MSNTITICAECKNVGIVWTSGCCRENCCLSQQLLKEKGKLNVINGKLEFSDGSQVRRCKDVNTDGYCQYFEPKPPQSKPTPQIPLTQKIATWLVKNLKPVLEKNNV